MSKDYGFGGELDEVNVDDWAPETGANDAKAPALEDVKKVAEKAGFTSREPKSDKQNVVTIRCKQTAIDDFKNLAKSQEPKWPQGYTFERAIAALKRELTEQG